MPKSISDNEDPRNFIMALGDSKDIQIFDNLAI
jgi:hypothetical protein